MKAQPLIELTDYLSQTEAARRLILTRQRVLQLMDDGKLPFVLISGHRFPLRSAVELLAAEREARRALDAAP